MSSSYPDDPLHQPRNRNFRFQQPTHPCRRDCRATHTGTAHTGTAHTGTGKRQNLVKCMAHGASTVASQIVDGTAVAVGQTRLRMERVKTRAAERRRLIDLQETECIIVNRAEFIIAKLLLIVALTTPPLITCFWIWYYRGGLAWYTDHLKQFNYHPLLMVLSVITTSGYSNILFRVFRCCRRLHLKVLHFILHAAGLAIAYVGVYAAQSWHNRASPPVPHYYSLHSWMGLLTLGCYMVQFVVGFFGFLVMLMCENTTAHSRATLVPIHSTFGIASYMLAVSTCIQGINEKCIENFAWRYPEWPTEALLMTLLGMLIVTAGLLMSYILLRTDFRYFGPLRIISPRKTFVPEGHYCFRPHNPKCGHTWRRTILMRKQ